MSGAPEPPDLLFAWERPMRFRWAFFGLLLLSAAVHVATFFLFQIVYPPRVTIPPPAPEVSLLLPTSPENRVLLRRIEADDPALIASTATTPPPALLAQKYYASYETVRTQPRTVAEENAPVPYPPAKDPLALIRGGAPAAQFAGAAPPPVPTRAASPPPSPRAPANPRRRGASPRAPPHRSNPRPSSSASPLAAKCVSFFSSAPPEDPELDAQAAAQLARLAFAPAENPIAWGVATLAWGDDAYEESPKSP